MLPCPKYNPAKLRFDLAHYGKHGNRLPMSPSGRQPATPDPNQSPAPADPIRLRRIQIVARHPRTTSRSPYKRTPGLAVLDQPGRRFFRGEHGVAPGRGAASWGASSSPEIALHSQPGQRLRRPPLRCGPGYRAAGAVGGINAGSAPAGVVFRAGIRGRGGAVSVAGIATASASQARYSSRHAMAVVITKATRDIAGMSTPT